MRGNDDDRLDQMPSFFAFGVGFNVDFGGVLDAGVGLVGPAAGFLSAPGPGTNTIKLFLP